MKQRITALDLQILTSELKEDIVNYRLQNIYNVSNSPRSFILKFSIPDSKKSVVVDCGNKVYLTSYDRETAQTPSNFVTKLRKHLKSRRLSAIKQVNNDRILVLEFSDGAFYLCLEFFSAGNIVLLDNERKIMAVQRVVLEKSENIDYSINSVYGLFDPSLFKSTYSYSKRTYSESNVQEWIKDYKVKLDSMTGSKKKKVYSIHKLLFLENSHLSSDLISKHLSVAGIVPSSSCLEYADDIEKHHSIAEVLTQAEEEYIRLINADTTTQGVIVLKKNKYFNAEDSRNDLEYVYEEFHPFIPGAKDSADYKYETVDGYNKTLDAFFSTIESTKYALKIEQQKQKADKRLQAARQDKVKQIQSLEEVERLNSRKGDLIIVHADLVEGCKNMVQSLLDKQMDWSNIESYIKSEQKRKNRIAQSIQLPLNLKENKINVILPDNDNVYETNDSDSSSDSDTSDFDSSEDSSSESSDSDESDDSNESHSESDTSRERTRLVPKKKSKNPSISTVKAWIDLSLSAYANARSYFDSKKQAENKKTKVEKSTEIALKNAERKIKQDLNRSLKDENETLRQVRPKFWFEKFFWFVTSEGYLCLAGRDPSQSDLIYYRHFNDNDVLVSSDIDGSLKVFVKNPYKGEVLPPSTLMQAGIFALSSSKAWDSKMTTSAWLIRGLDVSKRDVDGSLLSPGLFHYKSKLEYLPPCQLVMGFGFYWLGDEESSKKYRKTRLEREENMNATIVMDNKKKELDYLLKSEFKAKDEMAISEAADVDSGTKVDHEENEKAEEDESSSISPSLKEEEINSLADDTKSIHIGGSSIPKKQAQLSRGKKSKLKKIAAKYADQDEEERRLRLQALGTLKQVEQSEEKQKAVEPPAGAKKAPKSVQRNIAQEKRELAKYMEDDSSTNEASLSNYLEILDSFIPNPKPDDKFSEPIPVFAPWSSFSKHKYKVKVQQGNGKKGKTITEMLHYFTTRKMDTSAQDTDLDWPQERENLKALKNDVLIPTLTVSKLKPIIPSNSSNKTNKKSGGKAKK